MCNFIPISPFPPLVKIVVFIFADGQLLSVYIRWETNEEKVDEASQMMKFLKVCLRKKMGEKFDWSLFFWK